MFLMDAPRDDLSSKWSTLGAIGTVVGTGIAAAFSYLRAIHWRKKEHEDEPPEDNEGKLSLRALDKKIKDHDNRLDEIDLHLAATDRRIEDYHHALMRELKRIVGSEPES